MYLRGERRGVILKQDNAHSHIAQLTCKSLKKWAWKYCLIPLTILIYHFPPRPILPDLVISICLVHWRRHCVRKVSGWKIFLGNRFKHQDKELFVTKIKKLVAYWNLYIKMFKGLFLKFFFKNNSFFSSPIYLLNYWMTLIYLWNLNK